MRIVSSRMSSSNAAILSAFRCGDDALYMRKSDGFFNVSRICTAYGKRWGTWKSKHEYEIKLIAERQGVESSTLVQSTRGGTEQGTWTHRSIALLVAAWCNPDFMIELIDLEDQFITGKVTTEESNNAAMTASTSITIVEDVDGTAEAESDELRMAYPIRNVTTLSAVKHKYRSVSHKAARRLIRENSQRLESIESVPVPMHLIDTSGIYYGIWGWTEVDNTPSAHLKGGKAVDQSILSRIKDHRMEKPCNWATTLMMGCDAKYCAIVEDTMKDIALRVLNLTPVAGSKEEYLVPVDKLVEIVARIEKALIRQHGDILVQASDIPVPMNERALEIAAETERMRARETAETERMRLHVELEKHRIDAGVEKHRIDSTKMNQLVDASAGE